MLLLTYTLPTSITGSLMNVDMLAVETYLQLLFAFGSFLGSFTLSWVI